MGGRTALTAKIFRGADQPAAKTNLPKTIHRHAGRQRMLGADQPTSQAQPVAGLIRGPRRQGGRRIGLDGIPRGVVGPAPQQIRGPRLGKFLHHHNFLDLVAGLATLLTSGLQGCQLGAIFWIQRDQIILPQSAFLLGTESFNRRTQGLR